MSYGQQYSQYGGNPYGSAEESYGGGYGGGVQQQGGGYGSAYGTTGQGQTLAPGDTAQRQPSTYSQPSQYSGDQFAPGTAAPLPHQEQHQSQVLSNKDFLQRVETVKADINRLTSHISQIGRLHQQHLTSPSSSSSDLEQLVTQTQVLNTQIRNQIKFLETDAARSGGNTTKNSQARTLKQNFRKQLENYQQEEHAYRQRYQDQIARQYRIVNPQASEDEVREAANANWGDEGVFQTALKTNRSATAQSTLSAVRARHADIQIIERTLVELQQLFTDLAEAVVLSEPAVQAAEEQTHRVQEDTKGGVGQLKIGVDHARRARKLKWIAFFLVLGIIVILALVLGLFFGLRRRTTGGGSNNSGA